MLFSPNRMCWNREVSLTTGVTASVLSVYLLVNGKGNDIPVALVSLVIALMQFGEAFMWQGHASKDIAGSSLGAHIGILSLLLQPLVLGLSVLWIRDVSGWILAAFSAIWLAAAFPLRSLLHREWLVEPGCGGHLRWPFLKPFLESAFAWLYWPVMFGAWLLFRPFLEGLQYSAMAIGTFLVTWYLFPGEWGTLWCFVANLLPLGRIL
jgi:hypothetical protein